MSGRTLQRWLCRLSLRIASGEMREWAEGMVREIEEIEDPRAALEWAASCVLWCAAERLRPLLRPLAGAARLTLAACCLAIAIQMTLQVAPRVLGGATVTPRMGFWLLAAALFGATSLLVALRRGTAAWTAATATGITAALYLVALDAARDMILTPEQMAMAARERVTAIALIALMAVSTAGTFWLTRRSRNVVI